MSKEQISIVLRCGISHKRLDTIKAMKVFPVKKNKVIQAIKYCDDV